jgi:hypothetical protein
MLAICDDIGVFYVCTCTLAMLRADAFDGEHMFVLDPI